MTEADPSHEPASDAAAIADQLRPVILKLGRHLRREAQDVGVSALDAQMLGLVEVRPGIGVSELAAIEHVSRPSMSAHVKRLMADGWLRRELRTDGDQRRVHLVLTDKARQSLGVIRQNRNDWLAARIAGLTASERTVLASAVGLFSQILELRR